MALWTLSILLLSLFVAENALCFSPIEKTVDVHRRNESGERSDPKESPIRVEDAGKPKSVFKEAVRVDLRSKPEFVKNASDQAIVFERENAAAEVDWNPDPGFTPTASPDNKVDDPLPLHVTNSARKKCVEGFAPDENGTCQKVLSPKEKSFKLTRRKRHEPRRSRDYIQQWSSYRSARPEHGEDTKCRSEHLTCSKNERKRRKYSKSRTTTTTKSPPEESESEESNEEEEEPEENKAEKPKPKSHKVPWYKLFKSRPRYKPYRGVSAKPDESLNSVLEGISKQKPGEGHNYIIYGLPNTKPYIYYGVPKSRTDEDPDLVRGYPKTEPEEDESSASPGISKTRPREESRPILYGLLKPNPERPRPLTISGTKSEEGRGFHFHTMPRPGTGEKPNYILIGHPVDSPLEDYPLHGLPKATSTQSPAFYWDRKPTPDGDQSLAFSDIPRTKPDERSATTYYDIPHLKTKNQALEREESPATDPEKEVPYYQIHGGPKTKPNREPNSIPYWSLKTKPKDGFLGMSKSRPFSEPEQEEDSTHYPGPKPSVGWEGRPVYYSDLKPESGSEFQGDTKTKPNREPNSIPYWSLKPKPTGKDGFLGMPKSRPFAEPEQEEDSTHYPGPKPSVGWEGRPVFYSDLKPESGSEFQGDPKTKHNEERYPIYYSALKGKQNERVPRPFGTMYKAKPEGFSSVGRDFPKRRPDDEEGSYRDSKMKFNQDQNSLPYWALTKRPTEYQISPTPRFPKAPTDEGVPYHEIQKGKGRTTPSYRLPKNMSKGEGGFSPLRTKPYPGEQNFHPASNSDSDADEGSAPYRPSTYKPRGQKGSVPYGAWKTWSRDKNPGYQAGKASKIKFNEEGEAFYGAPKPKADEGSSDAAKAGFEEDSVQSTQNPSYEPSSEGHDHSETEPETETAESVPYAMLSGAESGTTRSTKFNSEESPDEEYSTNSPTAEGMLDRRVQ